MTVFYLLIAVLILAVGYYTFRKSQSKDLPTDNKAKNPYLPDKFIVADIETTGLNKDKDHIIEIAAIKIDSNSTNHPTFKSIINPNIKIPKKIQEITGINDEMVKNGDPIDNAISEFINFTEDLPIVFYNAQFDLGFLEVAANKISKTISNEIIDALPMCRQAFPDLQNHKLTTVASNFKIETSGSHRALKDCELTVHVYNYASYTLEQKGILKSTSYINFRSKKISSTLLQADLNIENKDNPFYNKKVVFTGDLVSINRQTAALKIQSLGADINLSITKKTEIVVIGKEPGPSKVKKIEELKSQGQNIQIIYEEEFLSLVNRYTINKT